MQVNEKIYCELRRFIAPPLWLATCRATHGTNRSACCSEHEQKRQSDRDWRPAASSQSMQPLHLFAHLIAPRAAIEIYRYRMCLCLHRNPHPVRLRRVHAHIFHPLSASLCARTPATAECLCDHQLVLVWVAQQNLLSCVAR
jgi:hypothetical protein